MRVFHVALYTLGAIALVVVLWFALPGPFAQLDLHAYDVLLRQTDQPPTTGRISIVVVDENSIAEIGQWPWRRDVVARLVERLHGLGARVVAFDIILSESDRLGGPGADARLAAALEYRRVVTSYAFTFDAPSGNEASCVLHPLHAVQIAAPGRATPAHGLFEPSGVVCSLSIFSRAAGASGFLNVSRDSDGVVRRVPLLMAYQGEIFPTLGLAAVQLATGARTATMNAIGGGLTLDLADQTIPIDAHGRLLLFFRESGRTFPTVGASDVLDGRVPPGSFTNQIVFVGGKALGLSEQVATPFAPSSLGVEVHATVAENLLANHFIALPSYTGAYELGAAVAVAITVAALTIAIGLFWASIATLVGFLLLWVPASWALETRHIFFSPVFPMLSAVVTLAVLTRARVVHERRRAESEKKRRQQAHLFIVQSLTSLTGTRDASTGKHVRRTQGYTRIVASQLARLPRFHRTLTRERIELMAILAPLHDIGKVGIPDAVLNKPGPLTSDEYAQMQTHPHLGYNTIVNAEAFSSVEDKEIIDLAKEMVLTHHEWWDGRGYPRGLAGEEIPIGGRVLAVVDVYDALVGSRPYHIPMPHERAVAAIRAQRGTHFDPDVVDAFVAVEHDIEELSRTLSN